jgi:6-phosphogluconolactonase (cycloisomerase 2 family)
MQRSTGFATLALSLFLASPLAAATRSPGAVFAITNAPAGNAVVVYDRAGNGTLSPGGVFATGGIGTGTGLMSQGAVIVSDDQRFVFAVNAGSSSISSFRIVHDGLELVDIVPSGGPFPTSLTYKSGLLYVLNAGSPNSIAGFQVDRRGRMAPLFGSARPLSAPTTSPAQIGFSDDGSVLIVTERLTNLLDVYQLDDEGYSVFQIAMPSSGPTPYGFAVDKRNTLFVSEAGAGGGASSYRVTFPAGLEPVSSMVMTGQRAACWAVLTKNGKFGYVVNAGTGNISGFAIGHDGSATLLDANGITAAIGGNPTDAALSNDSKFLYVRVGALGMIAVFRVESDGSLTKVRSLTGVPGTLAGLAAY